MADSSRGERALIFLLIPALVLSVVVLITITLRNSLQLERLRERSIVEATYAVAGDNADRLEQNIIAQDNAARASIDVSERDDFGAEWLRVARRQTPTIRAVLVTDLASPTRDVVAFASRGEPLEDIRFRRLFSRRMVPELKLADPRGELRHLHATYDGQDYVLSYWQEEVGGRRYLVACWHYVPLVVHELLAVLYSDRDPQTTINVVDAAGRVVFGPPLAGASVTLGRPFETTFYKWALNASLTSSGELTTAVERRRILEAVLVGLSLFVVVAGLVIVVFAAIRERHLSALKSDFVANVSHELKTPLTQVRMFGELLATGRADDEKRARYLQIINAESERLSQLIENLLDFSRVERGAAVYELTSIDLRTVVRGAVAACESRAGAMHVDVQLPEDAVPVRVDAHAMTTVIVNLLDNAFKYAADGGQVTVELKARRRVVELRVVDAGPGVPQQDRKRIFDRFQRGTAGQSERTRGSGIGLALAKQVVLAHRGRIWVEPSRPHGATFVVQLPQHPSTRPARSPA